MAYKGSDLDLRLLRAGAIGQNAGAVEHPGEGAWVQAARSGSGIAVDEAVLACCNSAYDIASFHAADSVRLEHLLHALTRAAAGVDLLSELGVRVDGLRRETAAAIAADMPAGAIERSEAPAASGAFEDVLRRACELAARRWSPTTLPDVLRVLLSGGPGSPAAGLLLRAAADPQRLERWRDEPRREVLAAVPIPSEADPRAPLAEALREQLGQMESALRALRDEVGADRRAFGDLLREMRSELPALRALRDEVGADRKAFGDLLRDVWSELPTLRMLRDEVAADRKIIGELLRDVRSELQVRDKGDGAGVGTMDVGAVDALLEARFGGLGKATSDLVEHLPAIERLVAGEPSQELLGRLEAVEERIELRALEAADKVANGLAERLERTEASLRRLQEASDRNWTSGGERQIALEASVRAQMQTADEANKAYERHLGEIYQALVKLGANQQTLGDNFATWRTETGGDISIVNNRLQQLEHTILELLKQLGGELQLLRQESHANGSRRGNGFKRWLYGTNNVFAAGRKGNAVASSAKPGRVPGAQPS
ncbi:MAG: hypothetical protein AB7O44_06905 [Hyphomicrobiaceae bacterium]